jgi:hypothetical protein
LALTLQSKIKRFGNGKIILVRMSEKQYYCILIINNAKHSLHFSGIVCFNNHKESRMLSAMKGAMIYAIT